MIEIIETLFLRGTVAVRENLADFSIIENNKNESKGRPICLFMRKNNGQLFQ